MGNIHSAASGSATATSGGEKTVVLRMAGGHLIPFDLFEQTLTQAAPGMQKQMLGEMLYPKVEKLQPSRAGKITGMLLDLDNATLLRLAYSDAELRKNVAEAVRVLDDFAKKNNTPGWVEYDDDPTKPY